MQPVLDRIVESDVRLLDLARAMTARATIVHPALAEIAELQTARERARRAGDVVTAIAIGTLLRRTLDRRRTEHVAKRRLARRSMTSL